MPLDVPCLAEVYRAHLFNVDSIQIQGHHRIHHIILQLQHGCKVHEVSSIDSDIGAIFLVSAGLSTSQLTLVFDIIDNQASIVHDFCQAAGEVNVFVCFEVFKVFTSEALGQDKTVSGSPALTTSVEKVICRFS